MKIALQSFSAFVILLAAALLSAAVQAAPEDPRTVVERATNGIINDLNKLTLEQRTDAEIRRLVMTWIIPAIDQQRIAMGALGKHWRRATPEQRQAFIDRYRELQIRTYSGAFKAFNGEQFVFEDVRYNDSGDRALVKGTMQQTDGKLVPVDFRLYQRNKTSDWLVYDAVIAGLGMVKTYRDQLNERLQNISIDELLAELAEQTAD
ncbi:MlaC/ttg2D family ABC transporter substrate-binding protein [Venatoribacter cucullus]|nr:ABC transporter substrate-binding protein [Venatoribacter cucullus]